MLPKKVVIPRCVLKDEMDNAVTDYLSDEYGFCINSLDIKQIGDKVYATNIKWDTTN